MEAFEATVLKEYSLFIPDFPGFGVSPSPSRPHLIDDSAQLLESLITIYSSNNPVMLVAHSLGGLIATKVALSLGKKVLGYVSVEGNITQPDTFYSGKAAMAVDPLLWKEAFAREIYQLGLHDEAIRRYYLSLKMASPVALDAWAKSGVEETGKDSGGVNFLKVSCPTLYIYGKKSIPQESKLFLEKNKIEAIELEHSGHWPMIDETERFYKIVADFFGSHR